MVAASRLLWLRQVAPWRRAWSCNLRQGAGAEPALPYVAEVRDSSGDGTLRDPHLAIPRGPSGSLPTPPADDDSGIGGNSLLTFTPTTTGDHYISAGADRDWTGTYTLYITETVP